MPKNNNKKGKAKGKGASKKVDAPAADADDDLDDILAELLAGDMRQLTTDGSGLPASIAGSSASSTASPAHARVPEVSIPEATIIDAVRRGDTAQLKRWGRQGARVGSSSPLFVAVSTGASNAVLTILVQSLGADVDQADGKGFTPLMVAATMDRPHIMRCLVVDLGADVNQESIDGQLSVIVAVCAGSIAAVRCLVMELGADVSHQNKYDSALLSAVHRGNLDVLRCLVNELGVNVNQSVDEGGGTALIIAAIKGNLNMMRCLVMELGADVSHQNKYNSALLSAVHRGNLDVLRCLVNELGVNVNQSVDEGGGTALIIAARNGNFDMMKCLVKELGADVNQATHDDHTALMFASFREHDDVVVWLLKYGADTQASMSTLGQTVAEFSRALGATAEQTTYLEARTHCAKSGCGGADSRNAPVA
jgi:ankyrin repeat protein